MNWVWFIGGTWLVVGVALAVIIGRSIHLANLKVEHPEPADVESPAGAVVPQPAAVPVVERRPTHAAHRANSSPTASARSPLIGGCVSPAARIPSEPEHGVL